MMLSVSILLYTGCKSNINITEEQDNTFNKTSTVISSNTSADTRYVSTNLFDDDYFYLINDVKYANCKLYVSGFVISDNNDSSELEIRSPSGDIQKEYKLEKEEQFYFYNDIIYTFKYNQDVISNVNLLNTNTNSIKTIDISSFEIANIDLIVVSDNSKIILDRNSILHVFDNDFNNQIESDISDYLLKSYKIFSDSQKNVYLFTSDYDNTILYKFDEKLTLIYKSDNYTDMPGNVFDIYIENDELNISTINDGLIYTNEIDKTSGATMSRKDISSYEDLNCNQTMELSENEEYIGTCYDGKTVILKYPDIQEYYCTLIKDENDNIIEERRFPTNNNEIISKIENCENGDTLYIEETYDVREYIDESEDSSSHIIHRINNDGAKTSFEIPVYNNEKYPIALKSDNKGKIYIVENHDSSYLISCYNEQGTLIYQTEESDNILSFINAIIINDELYINYMSFDEKYIIQRISSDGHLKEKEENALFTRIYPGNDQYNIFTTDGKKIYGYNIGTNKYEEILSMINCGVQFTPSDFFYYKNGFVISDGNYYYLLSEDETYSSKTTIKLSGMELSSELKTQVINFNKSNDKYNIECIDYNSDEDSLKKLNMDITARKTDIVVFNNYTPLTAENYNSFLFADLTEYIHEDSEINEDNYFSNVINLFKSEEKIYTMVTEFNIYTLIYRNENPLGLSLDLNNFLNENVTMNEYRFGLAANILSSYIKKSDFVDENFYQILRYLKENVYDVGDGNKINFAHREFFEGSDDVYIGNLITPYFFQTNPDVFYCGFPSCDGTGIVAEAIENFSILNNSQNKDGAWEFIEYCLSDEYQNTLYRGIPIKKSAYEKSFAGEKEERTRCLSVIDNADSKYIGDTDLFNIIWEESQLYFNEERTLDDTVDSIKKKTALYFSETNSTIF